MRGWVRRGKEFLPANARPGVASSCVTPVPRAWFAIAFARAWPRGGLGLQELLPPPWLRRVGSDVCVREDFAAPEQRSPVH